MDTKLYKKDVLLAALAGEISAWLSLPILKNVKVFDILAEEGINALSFSAIWILLVPMGTAIMISIFYLLAKIRNQVGFFQLGKYGIIGILNTFLNAGIYNFFIFTTDIASGLVLDLFFAISFVITVTNSFFWNKFWSFAAPSNRASLAPSGREEIKKIEIEAVQFFGISAVVALVNMGILHLIVNIIGAPTGIDQKIWANVALGFTIVTAFLGNFFSYKYIVFSSKNN